MGPSILFCLFSICVQLKLHLCKQICGNNQYTIIWSNGSIKNCLNCDICHAGYGLYPVCGSHIVFPPKDIACKACPSGQFSDKDDSAPCQNCQECVKHEIIASNCTRSSDRICSGTCTKGYYFAKRARHDCQKCSYCCYDGNDEIQPECVNQGLNATDQHCSGRLDKTCGPEPTPMAVVTPAPTTIVTSAPITTPAPTTTVTSAPITTPTPITNREPRTINTPTYHMHPTYSSAWHHDQSTNDRNNRTIIMVLAILVGLLFAVVVIGAVYQRRKLWATISKFWAGRRPPSNIESERNLGATAGCQYTSPSNQVDLMQVHVNVLPPELAHIPRFHAAQNPGFSSNSNPVTPKASPGGTPCHTDDELDPLPDVVMARKNRQVKRQKSKDAPNDSTSLLDTKVQTPGRQDSIGNENVEGQEDIKEAEGGERKRSRSGSLRQTLRRKLSVSSYQPLPGEDPDEVVQEPLRVVEHPTHPTHAEEGSRVELRCKAQGKKNLSYQWLKDGTKIQGEHSRTESLVFDSVKVRDFGWYSCEVRCADDQNRLESVESSAAELDVSLPEGMRFKYLNEVFKDFLDTQQKIEKLLVRKVPGVEGWKQVASKWKMDDATIDSLEGSHDRGEIVISHLKASYPELTVYEFCKFLKEPNIRRLDIVNELLVYLVSVPV